MLKAMQDTVFGHPEFREGIYWQGRKYPAGEIIITEGEYGGEIFLVRAGQGRVTGNAELEQGSVIHPGFCDLGEGALFGEAGLLPRHRRMATVTGLTDCELVVIDGERLRTFLGRHPDIGYRFMLALYEQTASRLDQTNTRLLRLLAWGLKAHRIEHHLDAETSSSSRKSDFHIKTAG